MTNIIIGKQTLEKIKLITNGIVIHHVTITAIESTKEVSILFAGKQDDNKISVHGFNKNSSEIVFSDSSINENVKVTINDDNGNFVNFLNKATNQVEELNLRLISSSKETIASIGRISAYFRMYSPIEPKNAKFINTICPLPILSFNKEDFKSQVVDTTRGLSIQNEWIDSKIAGVNFIVSSEGANLFVATKTFHFKAPLTKGTFYPESSKAFVHDDGVIFLKEEFINDIYSLMNDGDEVKFFLKESCVEEEQIITYNVTIGTNIVISIAEMARKRNVINNKKFDEETSAKEKSFAEINREDFRKFFTAFEGTSFFQNNIIKILFTSKKGLSFKPFEDGDNKFEYFIEDKEIHSDMEFDVNFFVLDAITKNMTGENILIKENVVSPKRFIVSDGSSWFVAGKSIKQE